jgi:hypothetical protein
MKLQMIGTDWMDKFIQEEFDRVIEKHYSNEEEEKVNE